MSVGSFTPGGYRFVEGVFQYSAGVAAEPGHQIVRVQFRTPVLWRKASPYRDDHHVRRGVR